MNSTLLGELVSDTLYYRRLDENANCLQHNVAGLELMQWNADALPVIEKTLIDVVGPLISKLEDTPRPSTWEEVMRMPVSQHLFHGLSDLLGAYLLIGSRSDPKRITGFLRTLPLKLQANAIGVMPVFFQRTSLLQERETNDLKPPLNSEYLLYLKDTLQSGNQALREDAEWALSQVVVSGT